MNREKYLKNLIEAKYGNVRAFSEHIKLPYTTVRSILSRGLMNAKMRNIIKICNGLGIYLEDVININNSIINKITTTAVQLSPEKQYQLYNYSIKLSHNENNLDSFACTKMRTLGVVSAETGEIQIGDKLAETVNYYGSVPAYNYVLKVNGNSMAPILEDNQIIFVKKLDGNYIYSGQIVIALLNNHAFVKKIDIGKGRISLISLNSACNPVNISRNNEFIIQGIVII